LILGEHLLNRLVWRPLRSPILLAD
jgi:hypothetical protein